VAEVRPALQRAALGPCEMDWTVPDWLLPHQRVAVRQLVGRLGTFGGALLADAVGLGKTYMALAVATRYSSAAAIVPAALVGQWRRVARSVHTNLPVVSHETLSRGGPVPTARLLLVDEAHRFRNPQTRRYRRLAPAAAASDVLLITATPVVNHVADLVSLLRLFLADHDLALLGVPSLTTALSARTFEPLAHAVSSLAVARSPAALARRGGGACPTVPRLADGEVLVVPPLPTALLARLAAGVRALQFPTFADRRAAELLRLHLWYRLASSAPAFVESLGRHAAYLRRASTAARRGERLSRKAARALFGVEDDLQLELEGLRPTAAAPLDVGALEREAERVDALRRLAGSASGSDPKADALRAILRIRPDGKTIVFTTAVATARHLARRLGWSRLCLATGRGARIASGPVALEDALRCFAPRARGGRPPPPTLAVNTLIATDLLSEGLDLQDADGVIHYDLPWAPLRLEQRVGRAARLGSLHDRVGVWWFRPSPLLERPLALGRRLREKLARQLRLGAATSSDVGRARIVGGLFDWRATFAEASVPLPEGPRYAVVRSGPWAACTLRWTVRAREMLQLVVLAGAPAAPPAPVLDERVAAQVVGCLATARPSDAAPPAEILDALVRLVHARLAADAHGPDDDDTRRLARRLVRLGGTAARARDVALLGLLDQALDRLLEGLAAGPLRELEQLLATRPSRRGISRWLRSAPRHWRAPAGAQLVAALVGDGTLTEGA
jgi:superfamily II DNA or RNA helicase